MSWEVNLYEPDGTKIMTLDRAHRFSLARVVNNRAPFNLYMPQDFDDDLFVWDGLVEFWRTPPGGIRRRVGLYFIREKGFEDDENGRELVRVSGWDMNDILRRRIVAYAAGSAQAQMTDEWDDMIKAVATDNLAGDATASRDLSGIGFSVAANVSQAPIGTKGFSRDNLLALFQEICAASKADGTELYFDVVPSFGSDGLLDLTLRTYTDQVGQDRTAGGGEPVFFGKKWSNLSDSYYSEDRGDEINDVYVGGAGREGNRVVENVSNSTRIAKSIWNRCEGWTEKTDTSASAELIDVGNSYLEKNRPKIRFGGSLNDGSDFRFGIDWDFGDRVTCQYRGKQFDAMVVAIAFYVDSLGKETLTCRVEVEE